MFKKGEQMLIQMLQAKIHRATVTDANLNYLGSISVDSFLLEKSGLIVGQKVDIVNINNGERFSTYIIEGERNSGDMCLNGAAARLVQKGDKIILMAYAMFEKEELKNFSPTIVVLDDNNKPLEIKTSI